MGVELKIYFSAGFFAENKIAWGVVLYFITITSYFANVALTERKWKLKAKHKNHQVSTNGRA